MAKIIKALEKSGMEILSTEEGYPNSPTELNIVHNQIGNKDINNPATFIKNCCYEREQLEKDLYQKTNDFLTKIQLHRKLIRKLQGVEEFARKKCHAARTCSY